MAEAFTGVSGDVHGLYYNPAGLSSMARPEASLMHNAYFVDTTYQTAVFAMPHKSLGTFGLGLYSLNVQDIEKRTEDTDSPTGLFEAQNQALVLSYARRLGDLWAFGLNAKYMTEKIDDQSASAMGADVGLNYRKPQTPWELGAAIRHLGTEPKFDSVGDPLPMTVSLGSSYRLLDERLLLALAVDAPRDEDPLARVGVEFAQMFGESFGSSLRAGYRSGRESGDLSGFSAGAGFSVRGLHFDFAWIPLGDLGDTFRYSLMLRF